jgi:hypothetical protein
MMMAMLRATPGASLEPTPAAALAVTALEV